MNICSDCRASVSHKHRRRFSRRDAKPPPFPPLLPARCHCISHGRAVRTICAGQNRMACAAHALINSQTGHMRSIRASRAAARSGTPPRVYGGRVFPVNKPRIKRACQQTRAVALNCSSQERLSTRRRESARARACRNPPIQFLAYGTGSSIGPLSNGTACVLALVSVRLSMPTCVRHTRGRLSDEKQSRARATGGIGSHFQSLPLGPAPSWQKRCQSD